MKILWITKLTDQDPYKSTQIGLSEGLKKRQHKVTLVMVKSLSEKSINKDIDIMYLPTFNYPILSGLVFGLIVSFYLPFIIKKNKVDVVMLNGSSVWSPFALTLKLLGVLLIQDIRTLPIDRQKSILFDISLYLGKYIVDGLTTITPELKKILIKKYNLQDKKIGIWSSGIAKEKFIDLGGDSFIANHENHDKFVLMHHGTYSPTRGIENLIRSIGELNDSLKEKIKLLLVGIPEDKRIDLSRLCKELGVEEQIEIILPVEHKKIPLYIQSSDVGIIPLPPTNEWWRVSSPLKTLEYLAMGKPIIATDIPFHRKIFERGKCGVLLETNSPKALANAITCLYHQDKRKLSEMGKKGREIVENNYTWDHKALEVEKFIKTVLMG